MSADASASQPTPKALYEQRHLEAIAARWSAKAAGWDHDLQNPDCHLNEDNAYERFLDHLDLIIQQRAGFCRTTGVIDAGCATGLLLARIVSGFQSGIGVDISPEMIAIAQAKQIPQARFLVGDCFELRASCPEAGAIVSRGVLLSHYGRQQGEALLRSARACLVEGGFVFRDFLNQTSRDRYQHIARNKTYFEPEEICAMADRAGLKSPKIFGESERRVRQLYAEG